MKLLEGLAGGVKVSEGFGDMEQSVGNIMNNTHRIRRTECNIELVKHKKQLIIEEVTLLKKKINQKLDKLQNELMAGLDKIVTQCCITIESMISTLNNQDSEILH